MMLNLLLLALTGFVPITLPAVPRTYHLIMTPMKWSDAQNYCRGTYDDLAVIGSSDDWLRLKTEAENQQMTSPAWIGLYNNLDSWRFSYNDFLLKNITLRQWHSGEPSNGEESCGAVEYTGDWFDCFCSDLKSFICYDSLLSGVTRFIPYTLPPLTWAAAQSYCRTIHTDLATAMNLDENTELKNKVTFMTQAWFGLFRDTWTWTDGTVASDIPWTNSQPDLQGMPNCGTYAGGRISDEKCSSVHAFFCHSIPPVKHQQIMRLHVKSDGSVFDPHMQDFILQKIKQKLTENGMKIENITVTWRKQRNGNMFYKKNKADL